MHTCVHECFVRFSQEAGEVFHTNVENVLYNCCRKLQRFARSGENKISRAEILALLNILKQFKRLPVRQADSQKLQYHLNKQYRYYTTLIKLTQ